MTKLRTPKEAWKIKEFRWGVFPLIIFSVIAFIVNLIPPSLSKDIEGTRYYPISQVMAILLLCLGLVPSFIIVVNIINKKQKEVQK